MVRALLHGLGRLPELGWERVWIAVLGVTALMILAAFGALWIRRRGSSELKGAVVIGLFVILAVGLFVYWPGRFALAVTLPLGACVGADLLKRKGYLPNGGK